ncbi:MAG: cupredoxin domain-containing protein [Chloroflexota bacterium]
MGKIDFGGAILALLMGFILSAGLTGFVISAGGYQLPARPAPVLAGPAGAVAPAPAVAAAPAASSKAPVELKIVATDLKFTPPTLQAKVGQPVKVTLDNKGVIEHDLSFPNIQANKPATELKAIAKPNQSAVLEFTPTAKGAYEYICTIPGHKDAGMKGTINVTD